MSLTPAELKKMERIEKAIAEQEKEREAIKQKGANNFAKQAIKLGLWKLDKKTVTAELKNLSEKYKTLS